MASFSPCWMPESVSTVSSTVAGAMPGFMRYSRVTGAPVTVSAPGPLTVTGDAAPGLAPAPVVRGSALSFADPALAGPAACCPGTEIIAMRATPVFGPGGGQVRAAAETAASLPAPVAAGD